MGTLTYSGTGKYEDRGTPIPVYVALIPYKDTLIYTGTPVYVGVPLHIGMNNTQTIKTQFQLIQHCSHVLKTSRNQTELFGGLIRITLK